MNILNKFFDFEMLVLISFFRKPPVDVTCFVVGNDFVGKLKLTIVEIEFECRQ